MKTIKRLFLTLLVFTLLASSVPFAVSAASAGAIEIGSASGYPGDIVALPVTLTALPGDGFISGVISVAYGDDLEYVNTVQNGTNYGSLLFSKPNEADALSNVVQLIYSNSLASNYDYTGLMATVYFRIKSGATVGSGDSTKLTLTASGFFDEYLAPVTVNGSSAVVEVLERDSVLGETLVGHSLTLDGAIALNFHVSVPALVASDPDAKVTFTVDGVETTVVEKKLSECRVDGSDLILSCNLPSTMWSRTVTAQITDGSGVSGEAYSYSVKNYALYMLSGNFTTGDAAKDESLKALCVALLNYGGFSQSYFGYFDESAEELANGNIVYGDNKLISKEVKASLDTAIAVDTVASASGSATGVTYEGVNVAVDAATAMSHYFTVEGDIANLSFTLTYNDGADREEALVPVLADGKYSVTVENIPAAYLDLPYTVTVTNAADSSSMTVVYSVRSYMAHSIGAASTDFAKVLRAMYLYGEAANAFFGK